MRLVSLRHGIALAFLFAARSEAQTVAPGFALERYEPAEKGSFFFAADSLDLRGNLHVAAGIDADYAYKPLVVYDTKGVERQALVASQLFAHAGASLVMFDRVRLGLDIPVALSQGGQDALVGTTLYKAPASSVGLGDVRIGLDGRIVGEYGESFTLAAGVRVWAPTGKPSLYTGDGAVRAFPHLSAAGVGEAYAWAASIGYDWRKTQTFGGSPLGGALALSFSAAWRGMDGRLLIGPEMLGSSVLGGAKPFTAAGSPFEGFLGFHYLMDSFTFGLAVGPGLSRGLGAPLARGVLSAAWTPPPPTPPPGPDSDGDGIEDKLDACPGVKGSPSRDPRSNGCPADADGDGIPDNEDACPTSEGPRNPDPRKNGCPVDSDGDGIPDKEDACPHKAGPANNDPRKNGCPADFDNDGIPDKEDACPYRPGPPSKDPRLNGCPTVDSDKDGIPDVIDACPGVPGPKNVNPKLNGCPPAGRK